MKRRVSQISVLIVALMMLAACAQIKAWIQGTELTPAARYYDALTTFNRNVETYNATYRLSSPATQAQWKAQIDPVIRLASTALDAWKVALNTPSSVSAEQVWQDASKQLLGMLIASGVIKIE